MLHNFAYITVLSNDAYFPGIKGLFFSWRRTASVYPFYVLVGIQVSKEVRNKLSIFVGGGGHLIESNETIRVDQLSLEGNNLSFNRRWNFTFDKLLIFKQTQFDKLIFLDADMMVLQNLDCLFEKLHMSAVCAGVSYPGNESWCGGLNSGLMVVEPNDCLVEEFIKMIPVVLKEKVSFGDQDLLKAYYKDWGDQNELHLDEKYNVFSDYLDYYIKYLGYHFSLSVEDEKAIAIIHFVGENKPWKRRKSLFIAIYHNLYLFCCRIFNVYSWKRYSIEYFNLVNHR